MINGEKIREFMRQKEIQGDELAGQIGVSPAMMSYIINGLREPSVTVLVRISKALGCTVDELINK
jgi:transcriptional regulator with XRE-family HTH domain